MIDEQNSDAVAADTALFENLTSKEPTPVDPAPPVPAEPVVQQQEQPPTPEPAIPPSRLREEAEARRAAEREAAELRGRLAAFEARQQPQPQQVQQTKDFWEEPDEYFKNLINPVQQTLQSELQQQREVFSKMLAEQIHGKDTVDAAYQAFAQQFQANPNAFAGQYHQFMRSENPYGALVGWHKQQQVLQEVGNDPTAYRARLLADALKDPEHLKAALAHAQSTAQQSGNTIAKPAVSSLPSLNRVGATALPDNANEMSDDELFSKLTTGRRK